MRNLFSENVTLGLRVFSHLFRKIMQIQAKQKYLENVIKRNFILSILSIEIKYFTDFYLIIAKYS